MESIGEGIGRMHFLREGGGVDFFTYDKNLLSCVTLRIAFRRAIDDSVLMSDDNAKH